MERETHDADAPLDERTSRELLDRARDGDGDAREALWTRHAAELRAWVRRRLGRGLRAREGSLDLAQSVCRQALEDFDGFRPLGGEGFKRWLLVRASHKIKDRARYWARDRRDGERERPLADRDPASREEHREGALEDWLTPSRDAAAREEVERVRRAFDELPADQRRVILLARIDGLAHEEIARRLGRTPLATRSLLSRALARLALILEQPDS
jgi:RNA polymerase sigma factor (sigma-70 family)